MTYSAFSIILRWEQESSRARYRQVGIDVDSTTKADLRSTRGTNG